MKGNCVDAKWHAVHTRRVGRLSLGDSCWKLAVQPSHPVVRLSSLRRIFLLSRQEKLFPRFEQRDGVGVVLLVIFTF